jgi:hypothetical protein
MPFEQLMSCRQQTNESAFQYGLQFGHAVETAQKRGVVLSEEAQIRQFIQGLQPSLKQVAISQVFQTLEEAIQKMDQVEKGLGNVNTQLPQ